MMVKSDGDVRWLLFNLKATDTTAQPTKSLMLIVGLPFTVPMEDSCLLSSLPCHGATTFSDYISN
jgi:hypothetical protein